MVAGNNDTLEQDWSANERGNSARAYVIDTLGIIDKHA